MDQLRKCKVCKEVKNLTDYVPVGGQPGARSKTCITCEGNLRQRSPESERLCRACSKVKPIEEFEFSHKAKGYRRHECKSCDAARKSEWYNENLARERHKRAEYARENNRKRSRDAEFRERNRKYQADYRAKMKLEIFNAYGGFICACCGETEPAFLSIDHINNDGHIMRKHGGHPSGGSGSTAFYGWLKRNNFPPGFQVLCMNCNHGKARNGGVCPHKTGSTTISQESTAK